MLITGVWSYTLGPLVPQIANDFGVSVEWVGQASTATLLTLAVSGLVTGSVSDRFGHRNIVLVGLLATVAIILGYAVSPIFAIMMLFALLGGFAMAMTQGVGMGIVTANVKAEDSRRRVFGISEASVNVAAVVGVPIITFVATYLRWRWTMALIAFLVLIVLVVVARLFPKDPPDPTVRLSSRSIYHVEEPLLLRWPTNYLYLGLILRVAGFGGPIVFLTDFLLSTYNISLVQAGFVISIASIGVFLGNLAGGIRLLKKLSLRGLFAIVTPLVGIGWLIVLSIQPPASVAIVVLTLTYFLGGLSLVIYMTVLSDVTRASPATTMTTDTSMNALGAALGTLVAGILLHFFGYPAVGLAMPVFSLAAVLLISQPRPIRSLLPGAPKSDSRVPPNDKDK